MYRMGGLLSKYHIQQFSDASIDRHIISHKLRNDEEIALYSRDFL